MEPGSEPVPAQVAANRWRIRRRMAITAFIAMLAYPLFLQILPEDKLKPMVDLAFYYYGAMSSIVLAYIGGVVMDDWKQKQ